MYPQDLRVNGLIDPLGVDRNPVFAWKIGTSERDVLLVHAQVELTSDTGMVWDSGKLATPTVPTIEYTGPALTPTTAYQWRARVWNQHDVVSEWSAQSAFETGLLGTELADARWIRLDEETPVGTKAPVQYLRTEFTLDAPVRRARSISTALGWYRLHVNGEDATGPGFYPGFTAFESRVEYQVRDITAFVQEGPNAVGILLSDGRFRGRIGGTAEPAMYGNRTAAIAYLEIELENGRTVRIVTDENWEGGHGAIIDSDPRDGETIDARLRTDWDVVSGRLAEEVAVVAVDEKRVLVGESAPPMRPGDHIPAVENRTAPSGVQIVDFGQNVHGVTRLSVRGPAGAVVAVRTSEVLTTTGELELDYLMPGIDDSVLHLGPNVYTLSGSDDVFEPTFCTQGYRYVSIEASEGIEILDIVSIPVHADLEYHGRFDSSNPLVNRFHDNVLWSMKGNFLDVPTDCPTRERSGWTGDAQVFAHTALLFADAAPFLGNWLTDVRLQQHSDGTIPDVVPMDGENWREGGERHELMPGLQLPPSGSAGWGDAIVLIPWDLYEATGSLAPLRENYEAMVKWIERYARMARSTSTDGYLVDSGYHWGEWLEPAGEGDGNDNLIEMISDLASTPRAWVATAYFEHSSRRLAQIAKLLGRDEDVKHFTEYADGARAAWQRTYMADQGLLEPDAQATYVRALEFELVPETRRAQTAERLVQRIREHDNHLGTGFLSTGFLLKQLSDNGYGDVALDVLLQEDAPSWLNQVQRGATTIWETWTGVDANGQPTASYNHYSPGGSARWLYEHLAGIRLAAPGWRHVIVEPLINSRITHVAAATGTPFGEIASEWTYSDGTVVFDVTIPAGVTAEVGLLGATAGSAALDGQPVLEAAETDTGVRVPVGSGTYRFTWAPADIPALVS
ncbi:family 78 glycoside hydrolase catalytic domain [Arthrobacter sp. NPDC056691]|uniref:family 78 glycoside hydrolase catalytic domain n=1 Tax=Arthrobacter sp. NPDC056691 TaxID=3345913 RepID=UPI00366D18C5